MNSTFILLVLVDDKPIDMVVSNANQLISNVSIIYEHTSVTFGPHGQVIEIYLFCCLHLQTTYNYMMTNICIERKLYLVLTPKIS